MRHWYFLLILLLAVSCKKKGDSGDTDNGRVVVPVGITLPTASNSLGLEHGPLFGDYSRMLDRRMGPGRFITCKKGEILLDGVIVSLGQLRKVLTEMRDDKGTLAPVLIFVEMPSLDGTVCDILDMMVDLTILNIRFGVKSSNGEYGFVYMKVVPNLENQEEAFTEEMQSKIPLIRITKQSNKYNDEAITVNELEQKLKELPGVPCDFVQNIGDAEQPKSLFLQFNRATPFQSVVEFLSLSNRMKVCCYYIQSTAVPKEQ